LSAIQWSDQKLWPFSAFIPILRDKTSLSTSGDSIGNKRKTPSGNYCKTLSAIKRSDQKLWLFSTVIQVWRGNTSSSTNRDSIGTTRKTASGNYCKNFERDQTVGSKVMALYNCYSGLARPDLLFTE
jgi:hypothetical protein